MTQPFVQSPLSALPELPRRPHPFWDLPERRVPVWCEPFGETEVSVRVAGSGPPLLLLHGLMTTSYSWRYVIAPLAERFTVYAPDLVGSGRTTKPARAYTLDAMSTWLESLARSLNIRPATVIGNSMGGYVAMQWALRHPASFTKLIVVHAPAFPMAKLWALRAALRLPCAPALLGRLIARDPLGWAHRNVHYYDESLKSLEEAREYGLPLTTPDGLRGFVGHLRDVMDPRALRAFATSLESRHEAGARFPVPLRLIYAKQDPMVPPWVGDQLHGLLPEAELIWLTHASHFAQVDAPDAFLTAVDRFLKP